MRFVTIRGNAMSGRSKNARVVVTAVLLTALAVMFASPCYAVELDRRPCRATGRRLYEELHGSADQDDGVVGNEDSEMGGSGFGEGGDQESADDQETAEDDYSPQPPPPPVYDKPRRGVRRLTSPALPKQYERKFERPLYSGAVTASENGLRATDTALLRGETIELPTYVNVPVTLRCRFVPLDGMDNKFETVVDSMYPGHADVPPPPPDSHASQVIRQLMGSVDGWRSVIKSTRPVRKVIETRFGWPRAWSTDGGSAVGGGGIGEDDRRAEEAQSRERYDDGRGSRRGWRPYADEDEGRQIVARRMAAERQQWIHGSRPSARVDPRRLFSDRRPFAHGQGSRKRDNDRQTENELIEDQQRDEQQPDDQQPDEQQPDEQIDEQRQNEQIDDQQQYVEQDDVQLADRIYQQTTERTEYGQSELVDGGVTEELVTGHRAERLNGQTADGQTAEEMTVNDHQAVYRVADESENKQQAEDLAAEEAGDGRRMLGEVSVDEFQPPAAMTEPEIAATAESDYTTFTPVTWIKTVTEDATLAPTL